VRGRLIWAVDGRTQGWACSQCQWSFSRPTLLTEMGAKHAYDQLAAESFQRHDCTTYEAFLLAGSDAYKKQGEKFVKRALARLITKSSAD
jgi:hypothetical protein